MKKLVLMSFIISVIFNAHCAKEIVLGGFVDIEPDSQLAMKAYLFLKKELRKSHPDIKLHIIKKSQSQVVAGTNVGLTCEYKEKSDDEIRILYAKVYFGLEGKIRLVQLKLDLK